jgi:hypothetical protein
MNESCDPLGKLMRFIVISGFLLGCLLIASLSSCTPAPL